MDYRSFSLAIAVAFLLVACGPNPVEKTLPTETAIPSATITDVPTAQASTSVPATQVSTSEDWLSRLEIIQAGNWARLQLLKTFPAEMPLDHSAVAISPDGKTVAVGSSSGADVLFYDLAKGQSWWVTISGVSNANAFFDVIQFLSDGTLVANSSGPYAIYHIDPGGNVLSKWDSIDFAISADTRTVAFSTMEGINLVDIASNQTRSSFGPNDAMEFSFSADGSKIAVDLMGVDDLNIEVWDIAAQTRLATLIEKTNARFSPDGKFLAVTSYEDGTDVLEIFSADGTNLVTTLKASDPDGLNGAAPLWSLDDSIVAAQIGNGSPVAWDTTNWQPLGMPALQGELYSFSPDGRILVTRTSDGGILFWGVLP